MALGKTELKGLTGISVCVSHPQSHQKSPLDPITATKL